MGEEKEHFDYKRHHTPSCNRESKCHTETPIGRRVATTNIWLGTKEERHPRPKAPLHILVDYKRCPEWRFHSKEEHVVCWELVPVAKEVPVIGLA